MDETNHKASTEVGEFGISTSPWLPSLGLRIAAGEALPNDAWPQPRFREGTRIGEYVIGRCVAEWPMGYVYGGCRVDETARLTLFLSARFEDRSKVGEELLREVYARYEGVDDRTHVLRLHHPTAEIKMSGVSWVILATEPILATFAEWLESARGRAGETEREGVELVRQACLGVEAFAAHGLTVDNLLPHNLVLVSPGNSGANEAPGTGGAAEVALPRVKVCEIPLRPLGATTETAYDWRLPAAVYGAPDRVLCASRFVDDRTSVYSLGVMLQETLRGEPCFRGTPTEVAWAHVTSEHAGVPAQTPQWLSALVSRCLDKRREGRPATVRHLAHLLQKGPVELEAYRDATAIGSESALETFVKSWPDGCFHQDANERLEELRSQRVARGKAEQEQRDLARRLEEANNRLLDAAKRGCLPDLQGAICAGADVRWRSPDGTTSMWEAVASGSVDCVAKLLDSGVDAAEVDQDGNTLFHNLELTSLEIMKLLVAHGAKPDKPNDMGLIPVAWEAFLCRRSVAEALLEAGASVTGLHGMALGDLVGRLALDPGWLPLLVKHGFGVNRRWPDGLTLLHGAVHAEKPDLARALVKSGADVDARDAQGSAPLHVSVFFGRREMTECLLSLSANPDLRDGMGWTPVMIAANGNHAEIIGLLAVHGADLDKQHDGETALMIAAGRGNREATCELVKRGGDTSLQSREGNTAFAWSIIQGHPRVVEFFLERGVDLAERFRGGKTALELAESKVADDPDNSGRAEVVRLLRTKAAPQPKARSLPLTLVKGEAGQWSCSGNAWLDPLITYGLTPAIMSGCQNGFLDPFRVNPIEVASYLPSSKPAAYGFWKPQVIEGVSATGESVAVPPPASERLDIARHVRVAVPRKSLFGTSNIYLRSAGLLPVDVDDGDGEGRQ